MPSTITLKVFRYDPAVDDAPYYKSYVVPWKEYLTPLQAIHYVNDNIEPIGFDYSCCGGLCGRCSMMVDGQPALACYMPLTADTEHVVEPLKGFPVVKDLFADRSGFIKRLDDSCVAVETLASKKNDDMPAIDYDYYWNTLERLNMCRECALCEAVCPVLAQDGYGYAGPAVFGQQYLRANDGLDQRDRVFEAVVDGVFDCMLCGMCTQVCPSHIDHVALHTELRQAAADRGLVPAGKEGAVGAAGIAMEPYDGSAVNCSGPAPYYAEVEEAKTAEVVEQDGALVALGANGEIVPLTECIMINGSESTHQMF